MYIRDDKDTMFDDQQMSTFVGQLWNFFPGSDGDHGKKSLSCKIHSNVDPLTYLIPNEHNLVLPIIQDKEVRNIIMALKNTAPGYDCIVGSIMKQCVDNYITLLTHIINLSIAQGYFPDEWKVAKVIPIFKDGDPQDIQNYRPISVLPFFSKILLSTLLNF